MELTWFYGIDKARSSIYSVVPLLFARSGTAQSAVDQAIRSLVRSVQEFEVTVRRLREVSIANEAVNEHHVRDFVEGCRSYCSGNLAWR